MHLAEMTIMGELPADQPAEVVATALPVKTIESQTAEDLLAELMSTAESEADAVTSVLAETVPQIEQVTYKVQAGDTLWKIANRHGMRVENLLAANNMGDANKLIIGQKLNIAPTTSVVAQVADSTKVADDKWYVVRAGDSLYGIGRKFESSVDELLRWNQLANADNLQVGQKLRLLPQE